MIEYPHLIDIQIETKVPDGSGGHKKDWTLFKNVEAFVQPISGTTFFQAQQIESKINYKVFIDFDMEITNKMRVLYQEKPLTIDTVIDQGGLNEVMVLMCSGN
ncbi:SPP1 family predicted phage head-tail adaptor [Neobacillus niacini]|uniref:phage head closure protein n=1 Tax=Neobacillus niacini TaxID=86668 RepID=UPI00277D6429|nr:phage head closure protein [Neobacillus niacini]MDQ1003968.1 SPP1 family predicted phage head-tail adaptor [Neobacillus niacini]